MQFANVQFVVGPMVEQPIVLEQTPKQSSVVRLRFSLTLFEEPTLRGARKLVATKRGVYIIQSDRFGSGNVTAQKLRIFVRKKSVSDAAC